VCDTQFVTFPTDQWTVFARQAERLRAGCRGEPPPASRRGIPQHGPLAIRELKCLHQPFNRGLIRSIQPSFDVPNATHTEAGAFGQLLLGQLRGDAVPPYEGPE
jgi:hypothetical protein